MDPLWLVLIVPIGIAVGIYLWTNISALVEKFRQAEEDAGPDAPKARFKGLALREGHLMIDGRREELADIKSLSFYRTAQHVVVNFLPTGTQHAGFLEIELTPPRERIRVAVDAPSTKFADVSSGPEADRLAILHNLIANETWDQRSRRYLEEIRDHGFFTVHDHRFHLDGTVEGDGKKLNIHDHGLLRMPFVFEIHVPFAEDFWTRLKQKWNDVPSLRVPLVTDGDCVLDLVSRLYGVTWVKSADGDAVGLAREKVKPAAPAFQLPTPVVATDFRQQTDVALFVATCRLLAMKLDEAASPKAPALRYGEGAAILNLANADQLRTLASAVPEAAFFAFAYAQLTMLGCVHHASFPGTADFGRIRVEAGKVLYTLMFNGLPRIVRGMGGQVLHKLIAEHAVLELNRMLEAMGQGAAAMNRGDANPMLPMQRMVIDWLRPTLSRGDLEHVARQLVVAMRDLMPLGAKTMGVALAPKPGAMEHVATHESEAAPPTTEAADDAFADKPTHEALISWFRRRATETDWQNAMAMSYMFARSGQSPEQSMFSGMRIVVVSQKGNASGERARALIVQTIGKMSPDMREVAMRVGSEFRRGVGAG